MVVHQTVISLLETGMQLIKQLIFGILACIAATVAKARLFRILPRRFRASKKVLLFLEGITLLRDVPFSFDAEVGGTKFRLHGPFQYAFRYYIAYLGQGSHEPAVIAHVTQIVQQCATPRILDVGAHYGWYTVYLGKITANRGIVFAFEPGEAIFAALKRNVELNDLSNVRLYRLALSDKQETISMVPSKDIPWES